MKKKPITKPRVPTKWRWHYDALLAERERLLGERTALLRAAAEPPEPRNVLETEGSTDECDHQLALYELSAACAVVREVDDAIHRILNGTYGFCEMTHRPILAARLRAIPWTRYSLKAEEQVERSKAIAGSHVVGLHRV